MLLPCLLTPSNSTNQAYFTTTRQGLKLTHSHMYTHPHLPTPPHRPGRRDSLRYSTSYPDKGCSSVWSPLWGACRSCWAGAMYVMEGGREGGRGGWEGGRTRKTGGREGRSI